MTGRKRLEGRVLFVRSYIALVVLDDFGAVFAGCTYQFEFLHHLYHHRAAIRAYTNRFVVAQFVASKAPPSTVRLQLTCTTLASRWVAKVCV